MSGVEKTDAPVVRSPVRSVPEAGRQHLQCTPTLLTTTLLTAREGRNLQIIFIALHRAKREQRAMSSDVTSGDDEQGAACM